MSANDNFPTFDDFQDLPATQYEHMGQARFPAYGLGLSIDTVSALQLSASNDSLDSSNLLSPQSTVSTDPDVCAIFIHLFNVLETTLAFQADGFCEYNGDSMPIPCTISIILDIISYLKRSVLPESSIISHSDIDVPEVLKSYDLSSMLSTYVAVPFSNTLRQRLTRTELLLSDYPIPMPESLAAVVSFVLAIGSLSRHMRHEQHDCHGIYCASNVDALPDYSILERLLANDDFPAYRPCIQRSLESQPHESMGHMLVCLIYFAVCHFRQLASVSYHFPSNGQCSSDNTVKTLLALIETLIYDCDESMLKRRLLTPEQLTERAKEDFELGLNELEQQARQVLNARSSPQQGESQLRVVTTDITAWSMHSLQGTPTSDSTSSFTWSANTSPSTPSLASSTGTPPELPTLPTPTSPNHLSFSGEPLYEERCSECGRPFRAKTGEQEGLKGRITRHRNTSCPKNQNKESHKCRVCDKRYGRSDSKLHHERKKHGDELADVLTPKRKKSEAFA